MARRVFLSAEKLTEIVRAQSPLLEEHRGVSDHTPNAQEIWFQGQSFILVTFNILAPRCVPYVNLIPFDGGALPHWIKCADDQFGLEKAPFARPYRQVDREGAIMDAITSLFKRNKRVILCLQECDANFHRKLSAKLSLSIYPARLTKKDECVTVWSRDFEEVEPPRSPLAPFRLFDNKLHLFNVHLSFNTRQARADLNAMLLRTIPETPLARVPCLVVGDFNIPVMPQSEKVAEEKDSCTSDLVGTARWLEQFNVTPTFALSALKFTNFVPRMNCAEPLRSWDHMDNIMMLDFSQGEEHAATTTPLNWAVNLF